MTSNARGRPTISVERSTAVLQIRAKNLQKKRIHFVTKLKLSSYITCPNTVTRFHCVSSTPFGNPVVPDEHSTAAMLFFISIGLQS